MATENFWNQVRNPGESLTSHRGVQAMTSKELVKEAWKDH